MQQPWRKLTRWNQTQWGLAVKYVCVSVWSLNQPLVIESGFGRPSYRDWGWLIYWPSQQTQTFAGFVFAPPCRIGHSYTQPWPVPNGHTHLKLGLAGWWQGPFVQVSLCSAHCKPVVALSTETSCLYWPFSLPVRGLLRVQEHFLFFNCLSGMQVLSFFLFLFPFHPTWLCGDLCFPFKCSRSSASFSRCSVRAVPFVNTLLMYLWEEVSSMSLYPAMFSCKTLDPASDRKLRCHQTSEKELCELLVFTF